MTKAALPHRPVRSDLRSLIVADNLIPENRNDHE
jgi:hypothetical protein